MSDALAGLRLAVGTLSRLPVGTVRTDPAAARWAMLLAPVALVPVAVALALLGWGLDAARVPGPAIGALLVGGLAYASRGMHVDGLADTVDGLGAGWNRERALAVMRAGDVGPMGMVAVLVTLLTQAACIAALADRADAACWVGLAGAVVASRGACALAAVRGLPAGEGSRLGAVMAGTVPPWAAAVQLALVLVALVATAAPVSGPLPSAGAGLLGLAVAAGLLHRAVRAFGGVSGDVFGALVEVALTVILVVLAAGAGWS